MHVDRVLTLTLTHDVLLDVGGADVTSDRYAARVRILGVHRGSRGKTLREMFNSGPYFLDDNDNHNVSVITTDGAPCEQALPPDFATLLCETCDDPVQVCGLPVITLGDGDSACLNPPPLFAIGASKSDSQAWTNCAGWPQATRLGSTEASVDFYPAHFRIWIR